MKETSYSTQVEAEREARIAIWGDVPFSRRECIFPEPGTYDAAVVTATVNYRTVVFFFDNYGRRSANPIVLPKESR